MTAVRSLAPDILEADLAMEEPDALEFEAGQWVSVPFGPKVVRAYSLASTPASARVITLCADLAPDGIGSRWFRGLRPGAEVRFKGPLGGFVLPGTETRRLLFVAEEIGIVPIRSMLAWREERGDSRAAALVYAARETAGHVYDAEFRELAGRDAGFTYETVIGAEALVAAAQRAAGPVDGLVAYVAGGEATIARVREALMARGLPRKAVRWERFW